MRPARTSAHAALLALTFALAAPSAAAFDLPDVTFKEKAKKVVAAGKKPDVEALVRSESAQSAAWILRTSEILVEREDPSERALRDALAEAWNAVHKTAFPAKLDEYLRGLDDQKRKTRVDLKKRLTQALKDIESNREQKDALIFVQTLEELEVVGGAFETEGDAYSASEAWIGMAECQDEPMRGTDADLHKAWQAWTRVAELRASCECKDQRHDEAEKRRAELAKRGFDKPPAPAGEKEGGGAGGKEPPGGAPDKGGGGAGKGSDAPGGPIHPPSESGNPVTVALAFEPLPSVEAFVRPNFHADEVYHLWIPIQLGAKGSSAPFQRLKDDSPLLHRVGSADLRFDLDRDGKADGEKDQKLALSGVLAPVRLPVGKPQDPRPWAFFAKTGIEQDTFQGVQVNFSPSDTNCQIYTLSAATVTGNLGGTAIRVIDDTGDGVYGSPVETYGYPGLTNGQFQPELDSIVVGASKRARPWSSYQEIGGKWWKLTGGSKGDELTATPVTLDTGTVKLEAKGIAPTWVVLRGTGDFKDAWFEIVEGGSKGVTVPAGRYTLACGELREGKKLQVAKMLILPGKTTPNIDVPKGGTAVVALGAPFGFDFRHKNEDGRVTITGDSVVPIGVSGERYERPWNCVTRPEATFRKKGTKKGGKPEKMPIIQGTQQLDERGQDGWLAIWFPLDLVLDAKGQGEVEVQLVDKKHKLLGKIESAWKE